MLSGLTIEIQSSTLSVPRVSFVLERSKLPAVTVPLRGTLRILLSAPQPNSDLINIIMTFISIKVMGEVGEKS